ncbi:MAG: hypothetical protein WC460_04365 [Patescibacteria group bacterium]
MKKIIKIALLIIFIILLVCLFLYIYFINLNKVVVFENNQKAEYYVHEYWVYKEIKDNKSYIDIALGLHRPWSIKYLHTLPKYERVAVLHLVFNGNILEESKYFFLKLSSLNDKDKIINLVGVAQLNNTYLSNINLEGKEDNNSQVGYYLKKINLINAKSIDVDAESYWFAQGK